MIVYGKQIILHILQKRPKLLKEVYLSKELDKKLFGELAKNAKIIKVDNKKAQALAQGGNHQGIIAEIEPILPLEADCVGEFSSAILLAGVSDMGNIGAIARSAYAYGVGALLVCGRKSLDMAPIIRASSGAAIELPIVLAEDCGDLLNRLKQLKFELICSKIGANGLVETQGKWVLVMGSEDSGLPKRFENFCTKSIGIEMRNGFDSLNVSTAAAILMDRIIYGRDIK